MKPQNLNYCAALAGLALATSAHADFISPVAVTYSSQYSNRQAIDAINWDGMTGVGIAATHNNNTDHMWLTNNEVNGAWIAFDLGEVYTDLSSIYIWNYSENNWTKRGVKDFTVEVSVDGAVWSDPTSGASQIAAEAANSASNPLTSTLAIEAAGIRYVRFNIVSNQSGDGFMGISEVAFEGALGPDLIPPEISTTNPADDATGSYPGSSLVATFSEDIALTGAGVITIVEDPNGTPSNTVINLPDASVTVSGAELTIVPAANLAFSAEHEIVIDALAIVDLADEYAIPSAPNPFAGTASGDWTFTTVAVDASAPVATVYDPADNAVDVVPNANLVITFDEDVDLNYSVTTLLDEDFESDNGNFALSGAPNDWAWGTPNADNNWDLVLTTGNNGSAKCWGTVLGAGGTAPYGTITAGSDSILQGPDAGGNGIDLTGVVSAQLQFAAAVDAKTGDTVEVLVREVTTNDLLVTVPAITAPMDADWATYGPFDVSDAAGKNVYLEFRFVGADATYIGLYVDDVNVTGVSPGNNIVLKNLTDSIDTVIPVSDSSRVSVNGAEVTISPGFFLAGAANYAVQIGATAIRNYNDLDYAGIADDTTWNFTVSGESTYIGGNSGNNDGWNNAANWDPAVVPSGGVDVIIPDNRQVMVQDNQAAPLVTQLYSGNLSLGAGATLNFGYTSGSIEDYRALGTPGTTVITTGAGATFGFNRTPGTVIVPEIQMLGDLLIMTGSSTNNVPDLFFDHGIHGAFTVNVSGKSNSEFNLSAANTFSEMIVNPSSGNNIEFNATAAGSLSGDVTIMAAGNGNPAAKLTIDAADAMSDTATLSISGTTATLLTVNFNDTIKYLQINGVTQPTGTYGAGQDHNPSWYSGAGVLTVAGAPTTYWDTDGFTAGAGGGSTPTGTWDLGTTANWDTVADGTGASALWSSSAGQAATFAAGATATGTYTVTVSGTQDIGGLTVEEGDVTLSGDGLRMTSDSVAGVVSGSTLSVSSVISNDSARQLAKGGDGTLTLSGANTYAGVTKLEAGTISVPSLANATVDSPLGNYPTAGADGLNLIGGTLQYTGATASSDRGFTLLGHSTLEVNTAGETLTLGESAALDAAGSLTVTGGAGSSLALGHLYVSRSTSTMNPTTASLSIASIGLNEPYGGGALTFTLGGTATGNEVTGAINRVNTHPNNWDGCHDVIKEGSSVWTLSGNNNYNGKTIVNDGTLLVTGEIQQTASVAVNGPGVLGGTGTIKKATTVNAGGGLAPGLSAGTLTFTNNLNFAAMAGGGGGTLAFELDALAGTSDQIAVSGTLDIGQGALRFTDFTFSDLGGLEAGTYTLMTSGVISGWIDDTNDSGAIGSFTGTLQLNGNNLELVVSGLAAGSDYDTWADGYPGLTDASADLDFDGGGLETGVEWVVGGDPSDGSDDAGLAPTSTEDGTYLIFTYIRTDESNNDANTTIAVEYGSDLVGWTTAVHDNVNIIITETDNGATDSVEVKIVKTLAVDAKLFARLNVVIATP